MSNHAARFNWLFHQDSMRPTVLGRAMGRKVIALKDSGVADGDDADQAKRSPATDKQIQAFFDVWRAGDEAGQTDVLGKVVRAWRADNAAGGVPVHGHLPLPGVFAKTLAQFVSDAGEAVQPAFDKVVGKFDPSVGTLAAQQIAAHMKGAAGSWIKSEALGEATGARRDHLGTVGSVTDERIDESAPWTRPTLAPTLLREGLGVVRASDAVAVGARIAGRRDEAERHALSRAKAYGADEVGPARRHDLSPGSGTVRTLPYDPERDKGETVPVVFPAVVVQAVRTFGPPALVGGVTSVIAEWAVNRDKATGWDYTLAFLSGAASGALNLKKGKATFDVLLAMGTSVAGDVLNEKPISVPRALGAGLGAYLGAKLAGRLPGGSQAAARVAARRLGEKYIKEFLKEVFGDEFELTADEMKELWEGFENHYNEQWNKYPPTHDLPLPI